MCKSKTVNEAALLNPANYGMSLANHVGNGMGMVPNGALNCGNLSGNGMGYFPTGMMDFDSISDGFALEDFNFDDNLLLLLGEEDKAAVNVQAAPAVQMIPPVNHVQSMPVAPVASVPIAAPVATANDEYNSYLAAATSDFRASSSSSCSSNSRSSSGQVYTPGSDKPMTREQFYKMRPKLPKISKTDPRRAYAAAFAAAYNSCDVDVLWDFVVDHCTNDCSLIQRWCGPSEERWANFPPYVAVRGMENITEFWFSNCLLVPDLLLETQATKIYVRSDGVARLVSQFTITGTRLFDSEVTESIVCPSSNVAGGSYFPFNNGGVSPSHSQSSYDNDTDSVDSSLSGNSCDPAEWICSRVYDKMDRVMCSLRPKQHARSAFSGSSKRRCLRPLSPSSESEWEMKSHMSYSSVPTNSNKRRLPDDRQVTIYGTVTLHVDRDHKIHQIELSMSLSP